MRSRVVVTALINIAQRSVPPHLCFNLGSMGFLSPFEYECMKEEVRRIMNGGMKVSILASSSLLLPFDVVDFAAVAVVLVDFTDDDPLCKNTRN